MGKIMNVLMLSATLGVGGYAQSGSPADFDALYSHPGRALKLEGTNQRDSVITAAQTQDAQAPGEDNSLYLMKDLLAGMSSADRSEFLGTLVIRNGHIVYMREELLHRMPGDEAVARASMALGQKTLRATLPDAVDIVLSSLLPGVPESIKSDFFDNLMYKKGVFVAVNDISGLERIMPDARIKEIAQSLFPVSDPAFPGDNRPVCNEDTCNHSACATTTYGWHCVSGGGLCHSSCE